MTDTLCPYSAYRPFDIEWLGDLPAHWEVRRLKTVCRFAYGDSLSTEQRTGGDVPVYGSNGQVGTHNLANTLSPCIIVGRKGSFGKVTYVGNDAFVIDTAFFVDERHTNANLRWLSWVLPLLGLDELSQDSAVPGLHRSSAYEAPIPLPPLSEQRAIVRYLNHADGRIRRYVAAKQKLIALLEEEKQAVINQAVTRGLDPSVPLKPSGVEWLGDVPTHWETMRFKSNVYDTVNLSKTIQPGIPYIALENVESWTGRINGQQSEIAVDSSVKKFQAGDVLFGKLRPYLAKVTRPPHSGICVGEFLVLRTSPRMLPAYVEALLRSKPIIDAIDATTFGAKMPRANWRTIGDMVQPLPPLPEQAAIVEYLDRSLATIDDAIARGRRQIELLEEYRTRLIADVVTGKLDVRDAAARLPEDDTDYSLVDSESLVVDNRDYTPTQEGPKEASP